MSDKTSVYVLTLGQPNANGRIYTQESVDRMLEDFRRRKSDGQVLGEFNPDGGFGLGSGIQLANVSHTLDDMRVENGTLVVDITIMQTPQGEHLRALIDVVDFRPRGHGSIDENGVVTNYTLISIDAVVNGA